MNIAGFSLDRARWAELSAEERLEAQKALAALDEARKENPLAFYVPHRRQVEYHSSRKPTKLFFGGNRSGKTTAGVVDDLIQAVDVGVLGDHLKPFKKWEPPFYCRLIIPDLTNTLEKVVLQKVREWCPKDQLEGGSVSKAYDKSLRSLNFKNGSWFQFLSNEMDLDKFGGTALHRVHADEECREDIYRESLMRLIDYGGEFCMTMTPLLGMDWTYGEFWEPHEKARENGVELEEVTVVTVDMDDNPHLDSKTKKRVLSGLSAEERQARKEGRFVHFAGLIYPEWEPDEMVIPDVDRDEVQGWTVIVGIDPGWRFMAGVVYLGVKPNGECVVFDEIALKNAVAADVCREIQMRNMRWAIRPDWYVIDPSARNKNHETGRSVQMEYVDNGVFPIPGQNSVAAGINRVKERLQKGRLVVCASCPETQDEFRKYRWASPRRGENDAPEKPVKRDDHLLDALRYALMSRPHTPEDDEGDDDRSFVDRAIDEELERTSTPVRQGSFGPGIYA